MTTSKPPVSSRSAGSGRGLEGHVARAGGRHQRGLLAPGRRPRGGPGLEAPEAEQVRGEHPDRPRAEHERPARRPRLALADRPGVAHGAGADRRRLGQHAQPPELARHRDELVGRLGHELAGEAVQARDAALDVVAGGAGVRRSLRARVAVAAGAPHGRGHEVAAREAVAVLLHRAEELVAEDERLPAARGDPEQPLADLAVGPAHPDLERPHEHLARRRDRRGHLLHPRGAGDARPRDERQHPPVRGAAAAPRPPRPRRRRRGSGRTPRRRARRARPSPRAGGPAPRRRRPRAARGPRCRW